LLGESGLPATILSDDDGSIAAAEEKAVKSHKVTRVTDILQGNPEEAARVRAVIALGAAGDESAIPALETALQDIQQQVRLAAINALGRIGSVEAITIVGNVLLQSSADTAERVRAARVLWNHGSETAHTFLQAAAFDSNAQVRLASENPPPSPGNEPAGASLARKESSQ
jgi:HEAT repeat protein